MLIGQHSGGHQHGHLFRVACSLESSTHGDFRLAESHVTAYQTVHGPCLLHICLDIIGSLQLVGGVLIEERGLQLML